MLLLLSPQLRGQRRFKVLDAPTVLGWFRRHWRSSSPDAFERFYRARTGRG